MIENLVKRNAFNLILFADINRQMHDGKTHIEAIKCFRELYNVEEDILPDLSITTRFYRMKAEQRQAKKFKIR